MPTLDEIIQNEIDKRDVANSLLQYPADQLPWEPSPADPDTEHAVEDTTRDQDQLEKPRTLDESDIDNALPPPAKPEPLPPRKSALAEEAWTGKGSYWMPLTSPDIQAPAQDVTQPGGLDVGEAPATLDQVERAELVKMPDKLSPEAQAAQDKGEMVVAAPALPSGPLPPAPDALTQVEKGELVTPTTPPSVPRGTTEPAPATLTQVERGDLVSTPPGTAPKAVGVAAPVPVPAIKTDAQGNPIVPQQQPVPVPPAATQVSPPPAQPTVSTTVTRKPIRTVNDEYGNAPGSHDNPYFPDKGSNQVDLVGPGEWYVDPADGSMKQKAGTAAAPPAQPPAQPPVKAPGLKATGSVFVPVDPTGKELPAPPAEKTAQPTAQYTQPDGNPYPERVQAVDGSDPAAFIAHHTSGRGTVQGVINTLQERHLGVEYVMDRNGQIYATGPAGSSQILPGWGPKGTGLNNQNTVGMEIIAKDDADVTEAQKRSFARFIAARYPNTPIFGHGEVNPGHKEADEGASTKAAALALRASGPQATDQAAPIAQAVTDKNGLYQNEKPEDFVTGRSTTFSGPNDIKSGQDSGVGSPKLGGLATSDVAGVAVPEWVLVNKFGNNPAAWRKARADVIGANGQRLRLPIVDLGPGADQDNAGVVVDMTPPASKLLGGDGNVAVKLVGNAGPDVNKNPQSWVDEQAAIKQGFDSASAVPGAVKTSRPVPYTLEPVDQTQITAAQQSNLDSQTKILNKLAQDNPSGPGMTRALSQPIPGVSDATRQEFANNFKAELTKEAQSFYNEPDPAKAYSKAMSNAGPLELGSDFWHKIIAGAQQYQVAAAQAGPYGTAKNDINSFFGKTNMASDADQQAFLAKLHPMSYDEREKAIAAVLPPVIPGVTPDLGPSTNPAYLARAFDKIFDPKFKQQQDQETSNIKAQVEKNLQTDPRLKGTFAGNASSMIGQTVADMATFATPALWPVLASKISNQIHDQIKQDHPDWSEAQVQKQATYGTLVAILGQMGAGHIFNEIAAPLLSQIEQPVLRALARIGIGGGSQAALAGGGQAGVNIATGQPVGAGVAQAATTAGMMGAGGAMLHGPGEYVPRPGPELPEIGEHGPPEPMQMPEPHGPPAPTRFPVRTTDVLGPESEEKMPWYKPGPIITRAQERPAFSPAELQQAVEEARQRGTPEQVQQAIERLQPEPDWQQQNVYLRQDEPLTYPSPPSPPAAKPVPKIDATEFTQPAIRLPNGKVIPDWSHSAAWEQAGKPDPDTITDGYVNKTGRFITVPQREKALGELELERTQRESQRIREEAQPAPVPEATGTDKWVSGIANKFVEPRVAAGQIGEIAPGQGFATKDLVNMGEQMHPERIAQHVSDIMNGKTGSPEQAAAIRFREAQLSERAARASKLAAANPGNAEMQAQEAQAIQEVTDFHNGPVAKLKTSFHGQGMAMQGEHPIDLTTYNGQLENWLRNSNGKPAPDEVKPALKQNAAKAKRVVDTATFAEKAFADEVGKPTKTKLPSADEVRAAIMEQMGIGPCIAV